MPLRIARKTTVVKPAAPEVVKPAPLLPAPTPAPLPPAVFVVTDRNAASISGVHLRAGSGDMIKSVYENTQPVPQLAVHYAGPNSISLLSNQPVAHATISLYNTTSEPVVVTMNNQARQWRTTVSVPWTLTDTPAPQAIPRVIHQTYISRSMPAESYAACQTWWLMNPEYEYRFYDDALCQKLMELWFAADAPELQAYNMLYAGAYKSDIFRLALLYRQGGVWADVSSVCEAPLSSYIKPDDELVVCVDSPCQKRYANIHQAYLFVVPNHPAIDHILQYTVSTVIHRRFETPGMVFQSIAVTGPTAFAEGLNDFLDRRPLEFFDPAAKHVHLFKDNDTSENPFRFTPFVTEHGVRFLDHQNGRIWVNPNTVVITTKFPNFSQFRKNVHYSILGNAGYIYKAVLETADFGQLPACPVWQIWLQSRYVSRQMADAMATWYSPAHCFVTEQIARQETLKHKTISLVAEVWEAIDIVRPHAYKCDLLRALLLYLYGGLYVDADMVSLQSLDPVMADHDVILLSSGPEQIDNGLMYFAHPGHPMLRHYLQRAVAQIKARVMVASDLALTGPRLWTACVQEVWNWTNVPDVLSLDRVAIMRHEAITAEYFDTPEVQALALTELQTQALRTVAPGTTVVTWNQVPYVCTKYPDYNKERLIMGGTNFAAEFQAGSVFHS